MLIFVCPNCQYEWEPIIPNGKICKHCGAVNGGLVEIKPKERSKQDPNERLEQLFSEADSIIENHPELVEEADQEQLDRIEKLVEGVDLKPDQPCGHPGCLHHVTHPCEGCGRIAGYYLKQPDLPTRLRVLAGEINLVYIEIKNKRHKEDPDLYVNLKWRLEQITAELEKEE